MCEVKPEHRPTSTDHFPIETNINLPQTRILPDLSYNYRSADWEEFRKILNDKVKAIPGPTKITNMDQLNNTDDNLMQILQETIDKRVTKSKLRPDAKKWWNSDLSAMRKELNRLRSDSYKNREITNHHSHRELRQKSRHFGRAIISAKG